MDNRVDMVHYSIGDPVLDFPELSRLKAYVLTEPESSQHLLLAFPPPLSYSSKASFEGKPGKEQTHSRVVEPSWTCVEER